MQIHFLLLPGPGLITPILMSSDNVLEVLDLVIEPLVQRDPRT